MFKVEANLKEIASKQLTQRAARKEGAPRRPVTVSYTHLTLPTILRV